MKKLEGLQWLRALAALAVVAFHVEITMAKQKYFGLPTFPLANVGFAGVHLFFVLSGFVIFWAHRDELGRGDAFFGYFWKRVRRLLPPLWVLLLPLFFAWWFFPPGSSGKDLKGGDFVSAFLIFPLPSVEVLDVEWTLRHEMVFYAIFALLILNIYLGGVAMFAWVVLCLVPVFSVPPALSIVFGEVNALFMVGAAVYFLSRRIDFRVGRWGVLGVLLIWCGAVAFAFYSNANVHGRSSIYIFSVPSFLAVLCAVKLEFSDRGVLSEAFGKIGDASYAIYLVHFPVISMLCKLAVRFAAEWPREVVFLAIFSVSVLAGHVFHAWVERPLLRLLSKPYPG